MAIESLDLSKDAKHQSTNTDKERLANMLMLNTHVIGCKTKAETELSSLLHASLGQPGLRDIMLKIGKNCDALFSIFKVFKD